MKVFDGLSAGSCLKMPAEEQMSKVYGGLKRRECVEKRECVLNAMRCE